MTENLNPCDLNLKRKSIKVSTIDSRPHHAMVDDVQHQPDPFNHFFLCPIFKFDNAFDYTWPDFDEINGDGADGTTSKRNKQKQTNCWRP